MSLWRHVRTPPPLPPGKLPLVAIPDSGVMRPNASTCSLYYTTERSLHSVAPGLLTQVLTCELSQSKSDNPKGHEAFRRTLVAAIIPVQNPMLVLNVAHYPQ